MNKIATTNNFNLKFASILIIKAIHVMETKMDFVVHPKFGNLTFCPTNIGTGLRASVHVKVPKTADSGKLGEICSSMDLQPRGKLYFYEIKYCKNEYFD